MDNSTDNYLTDQEFFTDIKLFKLLLNSVGVKHYYESGGSFSLAELIIGDENLRRVYWRIDIIAKLLNLRVYIRPDNGFEEQVAQAKEEIQKESEERRKELFKIINKIEEEEDISLIDVADISWVWDGIYDYMVFRFPKQNTPETEALLKNDIDQYLDNFINNKLSIVRHNYYKFENQKKVLMKMIEEGRHIQLYGTNFILKEEISSNCVIVKNPDFLMIQTVYALEKMEYLEVVDIWTESVAENLDRHQNWMDQKSKKYLHVNLILKRPFIDELNESFREENPKVYLDKYDTDKKVLKIAGKSIPLAKKGKDTDSIKLLETLLKNTNETWHNDQIYADWGIHLDEVMIKNKTYHAGKALNAKIKKVVGLEDFIEHTTTEFRINPRYLKVDE